MVLFKFKKGPSARIDTTSTPLHEGYAYITEDKGRFYADTDTERLKIGIDIYFSNTQPTPETKEAIWFITDTADNQGNSGNE